MSFPILIRFTSSAWHWQTSVLLITVHFAMAGFPHLRPLIYSQPHGILHLQHTTDESEDE
jgi:hypothetical protein